MQAQFRGVFLTSQSPEATAAFYRDVAGIPLEAVGSDAYTYWRLDRNGIQIAIHDAEAFAAYAHPPIADSNLTHLYFTIDDREAFLAQLDRLNLAPFSADEVVVTVVDPDGRRVLFGTA
jgi:catechol 2,3-dioxygenase-like lactoylglutathione lyase family enzyme